MNPHRIEAPLTTTVAEDLRFEYNAKPGIHIIYNVERLVHGRTERSSVYPFAGYEVHYLARYIETDRRNNVLLGGPVGPGVELTLRETYELNRSEGKGAWLTAATNNSIRKPDEHETTWYSIVFGSGNEIKGFINRDLVGASTIDPHKINAIHFFHTEGYNKCKNLEIHLLSANTVRLFAARNWEDCDLYHLYAGAVILITCKYKYRKYGGKGLCFKVGNVRGKTVMVDFERYTSTNETYLLQVFIGETSYRVTSKDDIKFYQSSSFYNTKKRSYFDFDWNIDLLDVRMETTGESWS